MEPFLRPLLSQAGGNVEKLGLEALRRALTEGTLLVVGVKLWSALHSETWRHREAAAQAFLDFCTGPLNPKYEGKTKKLFLAACDVAQQACRDKLLQIYFLGLKILGAALQPPICGDDIPHKLINTTIRPFITMLIDKISELNFRARDISLHSLISIFRHPAMDIKQLIDSLLDILDKGGPSPDKQQWRIVLARLEILLHVIQEFGINPKAWDWRVILSKLVGPSLFNSNPDVRLVAIEVCLAMYKIVGGEVRQMVQEIEGLKPNIMQTIAKRMAQMDKGEGGGGGGGKYITGSIMDPNRSGMELE
jgi:centrosomal protein CEP104